ncbi:uncharacterized protein EAE97_010487 [Botrytis byssoidea]|uniref:Major facilitator superfamily (MFS) profile domain-containing protein n=1 Tax=Botrytis byssoidea TaxID=139641 RepID=A0A9P5HWZ7_9HELO|nr:uncharacterized protein EAE97_010487 [Botrytis byssoidea]KAF7925406.1 hypothetical protein EAE97_010487 [Botrytis byssoidea]
MALQDHKIEKLDDTKASVGSNPQPSEPITPIISPEGGLAGWLCVIGCSMCMFSIFGFLNAAGSIPRRILPGHLADNIGYFNTMTIVCILTGLSIITLWIPFKYHSSHVGLIFFAVVYGFLSGAFISLMMPSCAKSGTIQTLGQRFGTFQCIIAIGCFTGLPVSGVILNGGWGGDGYLRPQIFSAVAMTGGGVVIGVATMGMAEWELGKRVWSLRYF